MTTLFSFCEFKLSSVMLVFFSPILSSIWFENLKKQSMKAVFQSKMIMIVEMFLSEGSAHKKMNPFIFSFVLFFLFFINFSSLFPFFPAITTEISFNIFMGVMLSASVIVFYLKNYFHQFIFHLVPEGAPKTLVFILFLIEIISSVIRPLTLAIRLTANILAGHLIIVLCSKLLFLSALSWALLALLSAVEVFVSIIQAYIFSSLSKIYHAN